MGKRKTTVVSYKVEGGADYGPGLRLREDGRMGAWGGAAMVEIETRDDPAISSRRRMVRGARRRDVLTDLESRRIISKRMRDAAELFLEDCSIAGGSTAAETSGMPATLGPRTGLPERQVAAITRVNQVRNLLGLNNGTVFWWVVFDNRSLTGYEAAYRLRNGDATQLLRAALAALDEHYYRNTARQIA